MSVKIIMCYTHPTDKGSGYIHHNSNHLFMVHKGIVLIEDDDKPYHELTTYGFELQVKPIKWMRYTGKRICLALNSNKKTS